MSITTLQANDSAILKLAFAEMGVKEVPGKGSNKQIEKYFTATTLGAGTKDDCYNSNVWLFAEYAVTTILALCVARSVVAS